MKKTIIAFSIALFALISPLSISAVTIKENISTEITPKADILVWKYKTINGHTYKRLFNESKERW